VKIPKRIAQTLINSLKGGVVPRVGLPYIAVGRKNEIEALLHDVDIIAEGGASFRFIVGRYGSGKSFLIQTIRNYVMDKGFVVADADLSPERRLQGTRGQGLATYKELIRNLSTKTRPEGGALTLILVTGPLAEEILFRRMLYDLFSRLAGPRIGLVLTAAGFSAMHFFLVGFPILFVCGLIFQLAYLRSGSLAVSMELHILYNLVGVTSMLLTGGAGA
jgi:membrane protease YdiL (CAAX protease family)